MNKIFLLLCCLCCCIFAAKAQHAAVLNNYQSVFIPPLYYGKDKSDIYGIRQTVVEKLTACGVPVFLEQREITRDAFRNPCSMLQCLVNNTASPDGSNRSVVHIKFLDCRNDTVLICTARADILKTHKETRHSFIIAAKQALEIFNDYRYQFAQADTVLTSAQPATTGDSILWTPGKKLTWEDFNGTAKDDDPADALTYTSNQTYFASFGTGDRFEVESDVRCYFIKSKSWVKAGKQIEYLLNHEQRHFDLAEAGAREFRKKLKQGRFTSSNFRDALKRITDEINEKYYNLQEQYDHETNHSRVEEKQLEWNGKIDAMLKDLEAYK